MSLIYNKSRNKTFTKLNSLLVELHIVAVVREIYKPFELEMVVLSFIHPLHFVWCVLYEIII